MKRQKHRITGFHHLRRMCSPNFVQQTDKARLMPTSRRPVSWMSTAIWSTRLATICSLSCRPELVPFTQGRRIAIRQGRAQYSNGTRALGSLQGARQATGTFHSVSQRCNGWISSPSFNHRIKVLLNKKMALIVT